MNQPQTALKKESFAPVYDKHANHVERNNKIFEQVYRPTVDLEAALINVERGRSNCEAYHGKKRIEQSTVPSRGQRKNGIVNLR
jgi:hypothetical protein